MGYPRWLRAEVEVLGKQVLHGSLEREEAAELLHDAILEKDEDLTHQVIRMFARKQMAHWTKRHVGNFYNVVEGEFGESGSQMEMFSYLPRVLETSPGRFADIGSMTRHDWEAARRQAEVKEGNASNFAKAVRRAYDQIVPLLTNDYMTTADVAQKPG